jgi:glycosyltransferase involved in cell wall biosynthesis
MDVLHFIHQFPPESRGGSESYLFDVVQRQRQAGRDARVLSGTKHWRPQLEVVADQVEGIPVHRLHRSDQYFDYHAKAWHPGVAAAIEGLLREWRPKLVHVHHWVRLTSNLVEIADRLGIPAVVTLHDYYTSCPRAFRRRPDTLACLRAVGAASCGDCVPRYSHEPQAEIAEGIELFADSYRAELSMARAVLVSVGSTADLLARATGLPRERYQTLPLGYRGRWPGRGGLEAAAADAPLRLAFWGGMGRHKGVDVLLRAFAQVHRQRPGKSRLLLLGEPESPEFGGELRQLADGLPVQFFGAFDAASLRDAAPDVGVFPSTCLETHGLVLDECFELGLPCVTSDLGALAERAGAAGLRTRAGDAEDLAAALLRLLDEPDLLATLRRQVVAPSFGLDEHMAALDRIYAQALAAPRPQPAFAAVPHERRIRHLVQQRESAQARSGPPRDP